MLCDVTADVVDANMKTRPLTSASLCAGICGTRKFGRRIAQTYTQQTIPSGEHFNSSFTVIVAFETLST